MNELRRLPTLRVRVDTLPDPFLLRSAIASRAAGLPWPAGPERTIADEVARGIDAVREVNADSREGSRWP